MAQLAVYLVATLTSLILAHKARDRSVQCLFADLVALQSTFFTSVLRAAYALQVAAQSSRTSRSPVSPKPCTKSSRSPVQLPISLTFVPHASGQGGVLIPKAGKPQRKLPSPSACPSNSLNSLSEEGGSFGSDSHTSKPPLLVSGLVTAPGFLPVTASASSLDCDPVVLPGPSQAAPSCSPERPVLRHSPNDTCMSETLLLNSTSLLASSNSAADQIWPAWHPKPASSISLSSAPPFQPNAGVNPQELETQHSQLCQSAVLSPPLPVPIPPLPQPQYQDQAQLPFQCSSSSARPQSMSSPHDSGLSSYSITPPPQLPPFSTPQPQPQLQQRNLAQLLLHYPHLYQQPPGNSMGSGFEFDTQQLGRHLPSVDSNLSLSSSTSVCFHEPSIADQLDFSLMSSPPEASMLLNSDPYCSPPMASTNFTANSVAQTGLDSMSNSEYGSVDTFVAAAHSVFPSTVGHRLPPSPSPFYGRAASVHSCRAQSKVTHLPVPECCTQGCGLSGSQT